MAPPRSRSRSQGRGKARSKPTTSGSGEARDSSTSGGSTKTNGKGVAGTSNKRDASPPMSPKPGSSRNSAAAAPKLPPPVYLTGPSQSPRDPNMYRVARLGNNIRLAMARVCSFRAEEVGSCEKTLAAKQAKADGGRSRVGGSRSKCRRTQSDYDTPSNKRSRATSTEAGSEAKDINCVEDRVVEFNKALLHICETDEDGCYNTKAGSSFTCCGLLDPEGNRMVEGDGSPVRSPADLVANPEDPPKEINPVTEAESKPKEEDEDDQEPARKVEYELNEWNRPEPEESGEKMIDCSKLNAGKDYQCTLSVSLPWGPLFDPDDAPGTSELLEYTIKTCPGVHPIWGDQICSFVKYFQTHELNSSVKCMAEAFQLPTVDKHKLDEVLKTYAQKGSLADKVRNQCWTHGSILKNPKHTKFLSNLSKPDHPVRRCALGGKLNKSEISPNIVQRALRDYIRNNCKPHLMSVAVSAPLELKLLERSLAVPFGIMGNVSAASQQFEPLKVEGAPDPFDTTEFRKFYKILSCPADVCKPSCNDHHLILSFALPPEAWTNYRNKPLEYLNHLIGHQGIEGLYFYLKQMGLILHLSAECPKTPLHRNQFVSLYQICIKLTEFGFANYEQVLEATFAYLKHLVIEGPKRHIFKELQRIQAIKFHSLGTKLSEIKLMPCASGLSEALQVATSRDIVMANLMLEYNGPLLKEYMAQFTPANANIMLVSNAFVPESLPEEEPFLKTKFFVSDISGELMSKWTNASIPASFKSPERNDFIPNDFCIRKENPHDPDPVTPPKAALNHVQGDDTHDLWHLRDSRYGTRTGIAIHFAIPRAEDEISSTNVSLFFVMFKRLAEAYLYPAELAYAHHNIKLTEFGVMIEFETNSDKIGRIVQAMANLMTAFEALVNEEYFDAQKAMFRQRLCCQLKKPAKLAKDLERVISLGYTWPLPDYVKALDRITRGDFFEFVNRIRQELYFMLVVVGNALDSDAITLSNSVLDALALKPRPCQRIEPIQGMQFPVGSTFIKVHGLDKSNSEDFLQVYYQIGMSTAKNTVLTKLMEPVLREHFAHSADLQKENLLVLVQQTMKYNIITFSFEAYNHGEKRMSPEDMVQSIQDALIDFDEEMCELTQARLCKWKKDFLCCCNPACTALRSDMGFWTQGVEHLNMDVIPNDQLTAACKSLKPDDVRNWIHRYFLHLEDAKKDCDCTPEARQVALMVVGNKASPPLAPAAAPCIKKSGPSSCCTTKTCDEINLDLIFVNPNATRCDPNGKLKKGEETAQRYVSDLEAFKGQMFMYPSALPPPEP